MDGRRMVTWRWVDLGLASCLLLSACVAPTLPPQAGGTVTAAECPAADADPDGYLRAICLYLVAEGIAVAPGRPNGYTIKRVEKAERDGQRVVWVFLS